MTFHMRTDAKGRYEFRDIPPGHHSVAIEHEKALAVLFPTGSSQPFVIQDKRECEWVEFILRPASR